MCYLVNEFPHRLSQLFVQTPRHVELDLIQDIFLFKYYAPALALVFSGIILDFLLLLDFRIHVALVFEYLPLQTQIRLHFCYRRNHRDRSLCDEVIAYLHSQLIETLT